MNDLTVITSATEEPLSLAEAKLHLRVDHTADDTLIASLITSVRQQVEGSTRRTFCTKTLRLKLDAFPCDGVIELRRPPVQAVTSITYVDTAGETQTVDADDYVLVQAEPARVEPAYGKSWPSTRCQSHAVSVTFTAGYGAAAAVPEMVRTAMKLMLTDLYEQRQTVVVGSIVAETRAAKALLAQLRWGE